MIPRAMPAVALLLEAPPLPDRSKVMTQIKRDTLVLQVGGYAKGQLPIHVKNVFAKKSQIGQSASRTVVIGEMSLRRLKLSIYEVVMPREEKEDM
jgi:hypothetical protein